MPMTLAQAFEQYKKAAVANVEKQAARKDAEERAKVAADEQRAAATVEDNAFEKLMQIARYWGKAENDSSR